MGLATARPIPGTPTDERTTAHGAAGPRVAFFGPVTPPLGGITFGGVATHSTNLTRSLAALGAEMHLLATNAPLRRPSLAPERIPGGVWLYRGYTPAAPHAWLDARYLRTVGPAAAARYALRLARERNPYLGSRRQALADLLWYRAFLYAVRPDVIHVQHALDRHLYARLVRAWDHLRVPLVVTVHSLFNEHPEHLIYGLMQPNLAHGDLFITVAPHITAQATGLGADPAKIREFRTGHDTDRFTPGDRVAARARLGVAPGTPVILFVGNLEPRKAVDVLIRALPRVRAVAPGAIAIVVGSGESAGVDNQEAALRRQAADLGVAEAVWFEGRIPDQRLDDWYRAADAFALPSHSEAQGVVALEAMTCGLPVVVSEVGGLIGTVEHGVTGLFVQPGDVDDLAAKLSDLLVNPERRHAIAAAGRAFVLREYSWRGTAEKTLAVYREAIARYAEGLR